MYSDVISGRDMVFPYENYLIPILQSLNICSLRHGGFSSSRKRHELNISAFLWITDKWVWNFRWGHWGSSFYCYAWYLNALRGFRSVHSCTSLWWCKFAPSQLALGSSPCQAVGTLASNLLVVPVVNPVGRMKWIRRGCAVDRPWEHQQSLLGSSSRASTELSIR